MSPFNAWVMLKGLETLPIRVARQGESAGKLADHMAGLSGIARVIYPGRDDHPQRELAARQMTGGGQIITFCVDGGKARRSGSSTRCRLPRFPTIWAMPRASSRTPRRRRTSG